MWHAEDSDVCVVAFERNISMFQSEGSDVRIVAFRIDSDECVLSIHHGLMGTYECCHESKQWHHHMSSWSFGECDPRWRSAHWCPMSVVELGSFFAGDDKFGVNSVCLMNFISCLVSVRTNGCVKMSIVLMFLLNSCCLLFCFFIPCCFDSVSLVFVLVVFSQWVSSSHLVAQSFSLQEIATRDSLVSCQCVEFFLHWLVVMVKVQQEEATGHDDPATIRVTGAVAVVVFIERKEVWEAATNSWSENKDDEDKDAWRLRCVLWPRLGPEWRRQLVRCQAERQWIKDVPDKLLHSDVWTWLAQACATLEDFENNEQSEVAVCVVHRTFCPPCYHVAVCLHWCESQDEVRRFLFCLTMRDFYRLRVERCEIQSIERIQLCAIVRSCFRALDLEVDVEALGAWEIDARLAFRCSSWCGAVVGSSWELDSLMCFSRKPLRHWGFLEELLHARQIFDTKRRESEQLLARCVDHVELSCQMCVMCPHDPIA